MAPVQRKGLRALELWCKRVTSGYPNVDVVDLSTSFRDGLAFNAIIHHFRPHLFDFDLLKPEDVFENNAHAFRIAEEELDIPALLDPADMVETDQPDKFSVATYLAQFYHLFKNEDPQQQLGSCSSFSNTSSNSSSSFSSSSFEADKKTPNPEKLRGTRLLAARLSSSEESETDSAVQSSSGAEEDLAEDKTTPGQTPTLRAISKESTRPLPRRPLFNREELLKKYGEDIFASSTSSPEAKSATTVASKEASPRASSLEVKRGDSAVVASVCKQFELKVKVTQRS